jgi:hypothetical protein
VCSRKNYIIKGLFRIVGKQFSMDDIVYSCRTEDDVEEEADNGDMEELVYSLAIMWAGVEISHLERACIRKPSRLYLTRP